MKVVIIMYEKDNSFYTEYPGPNNKYSRWNKSNIDTTVKYDFEPLSTEYLTYLEEESLKETRFYNLYQDFESTQVDVKNIKYVEYLQYLADEGLIQTDRELYSHIAESLNYLVSNNLLHINKKDLYAKNLNEIYYSKNKQYKTDHSKNRHMKVDYSEYKESDDCREVYNNQLLNELQARGGEIYLNNNNKFYIKLTKDDELIERPQGTVERILSREFGFKVKITDDVLEYTDIDLDGFIFKASSFEVIDTKCIGGFNG